MSSSERSLLENSELLKQLRLDLQKREIRNARKEHFSASSMGYRQNFRRKIKFEPDWMTILTEAGVDFKRLISAINNDDIFNFFNNEDVVYKLSENEMNQLKNLLKDQIILESDLKMGQIKWSDEVYNLVAKLARCNGDISKMSPKNQAAVLTLVQFNNITPSFGDDYSEIAIETCLDGGGEFIEFTDVLGSEIYVRKASFVKAQILEEKIIDELTRHNIQTENWATFMLFSGILYFCSKLVIFVLAWIYNGDCSGYPRAMEEMND